MTTMRLDPTSMPGAHAGISRERAVIAFLLLAAFYFFFCVTNRIEAVDTLIFSGDAETAPFWSNPDARMLLFYRINRLAFHAADGLGLGWNVYTVFGLIGSLFAAGSVLLLYRLLIKAFGLSTAASLAGALTLAFSFGFLRYANEAEVYVGATFFTLLSLNLLFDHIDAPDFTVGKAALLGLVSGVSVTYYQPTAFPLFFAAVVPFLHERRFLHYLAYGAAGVALYTGFVYASLWIADGHLPAIRELPSLIVARSEEFLPPPFGLMSFVKAAIAILHDFTSMTWLYSLPSVDGALARAMPFHHYNSEKIFFAARNYGLTWLAGVTFVATLSWLAYLCVAAILSKQRRAIDKKIVFVLAWIAFSSATNLWLNPAEKEVWLIVLPAFAILVAAFVYEPLSAKPWKLAVMIALLLAHNAIGGIGFFRNDAGDLYAARTSWLRENGNRGDWILRTGDVHEWADGMRILRYPISHKEGMNGNDRFFNFMYFYGDTAVVQHWGGDVEIPLDEMLRTLKTTGNRLLVPEATLVPRLVPPSIDPRDIYKKLVAFGEFLKPYATLVDDGPYGKTYEIDKARLPDTLPKL